jgi:glycosyltransferase involved in cell wall biosynthesis
MKGPVLSIVTPTYQCGGFVRRTWANVRDQDFTDWEWVVVDDGSTDETADVLADVTRQDRQRVRVVRLGENRGRGVARAAALEAVRGRHVVGWDMDDLAFPDRLGRLAAALETGVDFAASRAVIVDASLEPVALRGFTDDPLLGRLFVGATVAVRTDLLRSIGYDPAATAGEDKRVVFTLARSFRGAYIEEPLYIYFETRAAGAAKAALDCGHELALLGEWARAAPAAEAATWRRRLRRLRLKRAALDVLGWIPGGYGLTVGLRRRDDLATLAPDRRDFLARLRSREAAGGGSQEESR